MALLMALGGAAWSTLSRAASARSIVAMTEGPFYPPLAWRLQWPDWDADLTPRDLAHRNTLSMCGTLRVTLLAFVNNAPTLQPINHLWPRDAKLPRGGSKISVRTFNGFSQQSRLDVVQRNLLGRAVR
jgi:hypothetical protein